MSHFIGMNIVLMIQHYCHLLLNIQLGCIIRCHIKLQESLQWNCSPRLILIIAIFSKLTSGDFLLSHWFLSCKMVLNFLNEIELIKLVSFLASLMCSYPWCQISGIWRLAILALNFILSLMTENWCEICRKMFESNWDIYTEDKSLWMGNQSIFLLFNLRFGSLYQNLRKKDASIMQSS